MPICLDPNQEVPVEFGGPGDVYAKGLTSRGWAERINLWAKFRTIENPDQKAALLDSIIRLHSPRFVVDGANVPAETYLAERITHDAKMVLLNGIIRATEVDADPEKKRDSASPHSSAPASSAPTVALRASA